jgi:phospholipid transport system substrate-binding protein
MPIRSLIVLAFLLAPVGVRAAAQDDALAAVRKSLDAALQVARTGGTQDEKVAALHTVARGILDTDTMGRRALGDVLAAQPPAQQQEYLELFGQLMVRAYLQKLLLFRDPRFGYGPPWREGNAVMVGTEIITPKDTYHVDYEMKARDGRWMATDVVVEGISLTNNYHEQFATLLRDRSFPELLDLMRRKTRRVEKEPT